ncbi:MAG: hypothetical protein HYT40_00405 [Candidatus Sungbacteria bacterium]|uniref:Polyamine aminopropyltransferase n=1 Tax=Candidatus Sungiibacteriota bacterium TaxID=2750080 RepID=A0A931WMT9_9BACT|nr:hypothetical protein [Candidatus Sungbacteria bacterium]
MNPENGMIFDYNDHGRVTGYELARPLLADETNKKQRVVIADLARFGLSCWIAMANKPDKLSQQFAMADEHWFHQAEVHATLITHGNPETVLGLGAGDFLIAWRALQHRTVSYFKMADWDHTVPNLVLKHVPMIQSIRTRYRGEEYAIYNDPRLDWREEVDVRDYIPTAHREGKKFDVIIGDLTANSLEEILPGALTLILELLNPGGVYVYQAGPYSLNPEDLNALGHEIGRMRQTFGDDSVTLSSYTIESFAYPQAWIAGYKGRTGLQSWVPTFGTVADSINPTGDRPFYSPYIHRKIFTLEPEFRGLLE